MAVLVEGALALLALALAWIFGVPLHHLVPKLGAPLAVAVARGLAATLPMLAIFWWLVHSDRPTLRDLRQQVHELVAHMFPNASIGQLALVALLAGVGEELLFRGVLQTAIARWTTPLVGLAITSLLFGAAHALSITSFALSTAIGLGLGLLVWHYQEVVSAMLAHALYDFVALLYISRSRLSESNAPPPEAP
jgi:membrane protease YdiL (CAAX protease family)